MEIYDIWRKGLFEKNTFLGGHHYKLGGNNVSPGGVCGIVCV